MTSVADELLDVVDENDCVTGCARRADVHARGLRHRSVHVLVSRPDGCIYVQRRALDKDCSPGLWDTSAAGPLGRGEDYDAAAPRELEEELGLAGAALEALFDLPASAATGFEFVRVYHCVTRAEPVPDPVEIAEAAWYEPSALARAIDREPDRFTAAFRAIFARYRESPSR